MKKLKLFLILSVMLYSSCHQTTTPVVNITNPMDLERSYETVSIPLSSLPFTEREYTQIRVSEQKSGNQVRSQLVDRDKDGQIEALLFQPHLMPSEQKSYSFTLENHISPTSNIKTYGRLAPERLDDFTWENDRVAFRTFGPACKKAAEEGIEGGTISSGIDCWLKKVDYSIIDKWYQKMTDGSGSYHEDTGEGLDNFHVGSSRGCGGLGIWANDSLHASQNFISHQVHTNGPIQTSFSLEYDTWDSPKGLISEVKNITTNLGSNFSQFDVQLSGVDTLTIGLTLHDKSGQVSYDTIAGWFNYHKPHHDAFLSTALIVNPDQYIRHFVWESDTPDESHLYVQLRVINDRVSYESGFFWSKSEQFKDNASWERHLSDHTRRQKNPLQVSVSKTSSAIAFK